METLEEKIKRVTAEDVAVVPYDSNWVKSFEKEKEHLLDCMPEGLIVCIHHFGSTAVPGLSAKPIVDMLIEISEIELGKKVVPEVLEPLGYDCFWRPTQGDDVPPWYTWCIGRDKDGVRTHHLHFVEPGSKEKEIRFRDILREHLDVKTEYEKLKKHLANKHKSDRIAYTRAKGDFIEKTLEKYS